MAGSTLASPTVSPLPETIGGVERASPAGEFWRRFCRHKLAVASAFIFAMMLLAVAFGPLLWRVPINDIDFGAHLEGPSW
ncbi:MAG: ABC transporter permease, partial [Alphaproteobacteria bacterium]|nr:ABC transporter permease [Alphaproteobacteria bacterium]